MGSLLTIPYSQTFKFVPAVTQSSLSIWHCEKVLVQQRTRILFVSRVVSFNQAIVSVHVAPWHIHNTSGAPRSAFPPCSVFSACLSMRWAGVFLSFSTLWSGEVTSQLWKRKALDPVIVCLVVYPGVFATNNSPCGWEESGGQGRREQCFAVSTGAVAQHRSAWEQGDGGCCHWPTLECTASFLSYPYTSVDNKNNTSCFLILTTWYRRNTTGKDFSLWT